MWSIDSDISFCNFVSAGSMEMFDFNKVVSINVKTSEMSVNEIYLKVPHCMIRVIDL